MFITLPVIVYFLKPSIPKRVKALISVITVAVLFGLIISVSPKTPLIIPEIIIFSVIIFLIFKLKDIYLKQISKKVISTTKKYHNYFDNGIISFEGLSIRYQIIIKKILASKKWTRTVILAVVIFSIFSYLLVPFGFVKNEFFPKTDSDSLSVSVELPAGTNVSTRAARHNKGRLGQFQRLNRGTWVTMYFFGCIGSDKIKRDMHDLFFGFN
jgi:multidrug efflux pump subunit AcrB